MAGVKMIEGIRKDFEQYLINLRNRDYDTIWMTANVFICIFAIWYTSSN